METDFGKRNSGPYIKSNVDTWRSVSTMQLWLAKEIIQSAEMEALRIAVPMAIAVVDVGGNLVACHKMDHALLASIDISINKAWTSVSMKMPTAGLAKLAAPGGSLFGIHSTNQNRIVLFGGGVPLLQNDHIIGGLGVSGGSVEQDVHVAEVVGDYFKKTMDNSPDEII